MTPELAVDKICYGRECRNCPLKQNGKYICNEPWTYGDEIMATYYSLFGSEFSVSENEMLNIITEKNEDEY